MAIVFQSSFGTSSYPLTFPFTSVTAVGGTVSTDTTYYHNNGVSCTFHGDYSAGQYAYLDSGITTCQRFSFYIRFMPMSGGYLSNNVGGIIFGNTSSGGAIYLSFDGGFGNYYTTLTVYSDGSAVTSTSPASLTDGSGSWHRISGSFGGGASTDWLAVDGTKILISFNAGAVANGYIGMVSTSDGNLIGGGDMWVSDIVMDDTFSTTDLGDVRVLTSTVVGQGQYNAYDTLSSGSNAHYTYYDDIGGDSDYVEQAGSSSVRDTATFQTSSTLSITGSVKAVTVWIRTKFGASGTGTGQSITVRDNSSDYNYAISQSTSFNWQNKLLTTMPNGGAVWSISRFDAFQAGALSTGGTKDSFMSSLFVMVSFVPIVSNTKTFSPLIGVKSIAPKKISKNSLNVARGTRTFNM